MEIVQVTRESQWPHIGGLTALLIEQMKAIGSGKSDSEVKMAVDNALKPNSPARFFLALDGDGNAVGCIMVNIGSGIESGGDYVWINEIHVRADQREQGVGKRLVDHIIKWGREAGYRYCLGVTSPSNKAARTLCREAGFDGTEMIWLSRRL